MTERKHRKIALVTIVLLGMLCLPGCESAKEFFKTDMGRWLSPDKMVFRPIGSPIAPIAESIGPADAVEDVIPNSTPPREGDWEYSAEDYVIGPTDIVDVQILDLFTEGVETAVRRQVSNSGYIDLPLLIEQVKAEDLTQQQLKEAVKRAYQMEDILRDPTVTVTVALRRQSTFSIIGAVEEPGQYPIARKDMRLLEALAMARGVNQGNIRYVYVIRSIRPARTLAPEQAEPEPKAEPVVITPEKLPALPEEPTQPTDIEKALRELGTAMPGAPATQPEETPKPTAVMHLVETEGAPGGETAARDIQEAQVKRTKKWVYTADGQWVQVEQEADVATQPSGKGAAPVRPAGQAPTRLVGDQAPSDPFRWREIDKSDTARVIAINMIKLKAGNPRMNIIVRENDVIRVPINEPGEFYMMGEIQRPGAYSLQGRRVTVKQAIAAAGNLGVLAWPENAVLIRRVADNQEQMIPLNIEAIFKGRETDIFLKTEDIIAIGTDIRTIPYAVMRNAFRVTYGFGFIYDRNFADPLLFPLKSNRFTRW